MADSQRGIRADVVRHFDSVAADRDHDLHPDHVIRHDGNGCEHGLPQGPQQNLLAHGRDGCPWRVFRGHAGFRVDSFVL